MIRNDRSFVDARKFFRAFERRFGQSVMPLCLRHIGGARYRVTDPETGSWAEYDASAWRIRRVAEHDAVFDS